MKSAISVFALTVLLTATVHASYIDVPSDQPTIQAGIDAAVDGDVVRVAAGTYTGDGNRDLDFGGRKIVLRGRSGAAVTIIDCQGTETDPHVGFRLDNGEDSTAVIDGFTITNARGTGFNAAIFCLHASVKVQNCIITNSFPSGIAASNYSPTMVIRNTEVSGNLGSGIVLNREGVIEDCRVLNNQGQAIYVGGSLTLTGTTIAGNLGFGVSSISASLPPLTVTNCTIVDNEVGFWCEQELPKSAPDRQWEISVSDCIIAFNREEGVRIVMTELPSFSCCDVYGNLLDDWKIDPFYTLDTANCISLDPLFCDTAGGNFRLLEGSPCGPTGNICGVQIGAWDVGCSCCRWVGDVTHDDNVGVDDLTYFVCFLFEGCAEPSCFVEADMDQSGSLNIADLVYLIAYLFQGGPPVPCPPG